MAELKETAACLQIIGDSLIPELITTALGKPPTSAHHKGDHVPLPKGGYRIARSGSWCIDVQRRKPGDLDGQISEILKGTSLDLEVWKELANQFELRIFCGIFLQEFNEGLYISAATTKLLGSRCIALDLDVYSSYNDEPDSF
ncbi:DUF4279 domain-containing protein [Ruegeria halocynthiae]|uniref:DUF4279 domain-containing protein n=1 Tax=Ruegeria halocynthiae TaxID=985054 RepID=UPI00056C6453|nr:DUF4279 domain-containing protein [Ruegeria halocynthiae]